MERIIVTMDGKKVLSVDSNISLERMTEIMKNFFIEDWKKIVIKKDKIKVKSDKNLSKIEVK